MYVVAQRGGARITVISREEEKGRNGSDMMGKMTIMVDLSRRCHFVVVEFFIDSCAAYVLRGDGPLVGMTVDVAQDEVVIVEEWRDGSGEAGSAGGCWRYINVGDDQVQIGDVDFDDDAFRVGVGEWRRSFDVRE